MMRLTSKMERMNTQSSTTLSLIRLKARYLLGVNLQTQDLISLLRAMLRIVSRVNKRGLIRSIGNSKQLKELMIANLKFI